MAICGPGLKGKIGQNQKLMDGFFFGFFWFSMAQTIKNNLLDLQNCEI